MNDLSISYPFGCKTEEEFLSYLIRNTEARMIIYRELIKEVYMDKEHFPPDDSFTIWFMRHLKDMKNDQQIQLKKYQKEQYHLRQGLNPPYCYPEYWGKYPTITDLNFVNLTT